MENECSCEKCKTMCKTAPCLGTPLDILKITDAGYSDKLSGTIWASGILQGIKPIKMVQPSFKNGKCVFLDDNELCILHDLGLKPTEGKLASCKTKIVNDFKETDNYKIAIQWKGIL